jgi:hypothetical protein
MILWIILRSDRRVVVVTERKINSMQWIKCKKYAFNKYNLLYSIPENTAKTKNAVVIIIPKKITYNQYRSKW